MMPRICALSMLLLLFPQTAPAAIVPLEQLRQVVAGGSVNTLDESISFYEARPAEDFGMFDDAVGLALRTETGTATADGFTKQVSTIDSTEISIFATADSFVFAPNLEDTAYASTVSEFSLRFQLTTPGRFHLASSGLAANAATSTMTLRNDDGQELVTYDASFVPAIDQLLDLPAGEYSLAARADSNGFLESGSGQPDGRAEVSVQFTQVPEPATAVVALLGMVTTLFVRRSIGHCCTARLRS